MAEDNNNKWRDMNAAEWRGKFGEKLDRLEILMGAACSKVDAHDKQLAILQDRDTRAQLSGRARATVAAALILGATSIVGNIITIFGS